MPLRRAAITEWFSSYYTCVKSVHMLLFNWSERILLLVDNKTLNFDFLNLSVLYLFVLHLA